MAPESLYIIKDSPQFVYSTLTATWFEFQLWPMNLSVIGLHLTDDVDTTMTWWLEQKECSTQTEDPAFKIDG